MLRIASCLTFGLIIFVQSLFAADSIYLKENLQKSKKGDFIVALQNKNYTVLHIVDMTPALLTIEEIVIPYQRIPQKNFSWKEWIKNNAPGNTCWVRYPIDIVNGNMDRYFSVTKNNWFKLSQTDNFLSTLLNLKFSRIPADERRRVGPSQLDELTDNRPLWQPKMIVNGRRVDGVVFSAWHTQWPKDGGALSGKTIEVFLPDENQKYPSYFPYWLQIRGMVGKAHIHIVDSGNTLM